MAITDFEPFSLEFARDAGTVVVRVAGELDVATAPTLRRALHGLIEEQGALSVRLDLRRMSFVDSTGMSVFLGGLRRLRQKGGELTLANPRRSSLRALEIVGLTQIFTIIDDAHGLDSLAVSGDVSAGA